MSNLLFMKKKRETSIKSNVDIVDDWRRLECNMYLNDQINFGEKSEGEVSRLLWVKKYVNDLCSAVTSGEDDGDGDVDGDCEHWGSCSSLSRCAMMNSKIDQWFLSVAFVEWSCFFT